MNLYDAIAFIDKNDKTVGGGAVSAVVGSLCATVVRMVAELSIGKGLGLEDGEYNEIMEEAEKLASELKEGAVGDSVAYNKIVAAYRLPKGSEEEKETRRHQVSSAGYYASRVPADNAVACSKVYKLLQRMEGKSNPAADSDLFCAKIFLSAAIRGCIKNIEANLYLIKDDSQKEELIKIIASLNDEVKNEKGKSCS